jgi:hypothetical protein
MEGDIATRSAKHSQYAPTDFGIETSAVSGAVLERKGAVEALSTRRSTVEPRVVLTLAQEERNARRQKRDQASRAVERVTKAIAAIERDLAAFSHVDAAVARECTASILRSLETAEEFELAFSSELMESWEKKIALERAFAAVRHAQAFLLQELQVAEQRLTEAERDVESAAVAVAALEVEPIAVELADIEGRAAALRRLLLGYGALRHAGGFLPMSRSAALLLRGEKAPHDPEAVACWSSYLARLATDAQAIFSSGSPSWFVANQEGANAPPATALSFRDHKKTICG